MNLRLLRHQLRRLKFRGVVLLKAIKIPGGEGARLYDVLSILRRAIKQERFDQRAYAMAFNFFLAFFPSIILLFQLLPFLPVPDLEARILDAMELLLPGDVYTFVSEQIHSTFSQRNAGLISITFGAIIVFATRGSLAMLKAFKKLDSDEFKARHPIHEVILALGIYAGLTLLSLIGMSLLIFGEWALQIIEQETPGMAVRWLGEVLRYALLILTLLAVISFLYTVAPNTRRRMRVITPGGVVSGILLLAAMFGLKFYFENFGRYNQIYGSLAAIMLLMIWFYWVSVVLLLGYELNVSIRRAKAIQAARNKPEMPE